MRWKQHVKLWGSVLLVLIFFVTTSHFARQYREPISNFVERQPLLLAVPAYIVTVALMTILTPTASFALIPAASQVWGGFWSGLMTGGGWILGGIVAFLIARRYGQDIVRHLTSRDALDLVHRFIPRTPAITFWILVVLEVFLPVDLLSYAAGLFTRLHLKTYAAAVAVGNIPSGIIFAYLGRLPLTWQLGVCAVTGILVFVGIKTLPVNNARSRYGIL